jgi:DNA-directed RNA polymerase specialized sigma24 family protein
LPEESDMRTADTRDKGVAGAGLTCPDDPYPSLMERYQAGDAQAFEALYTRLRPDLEAYLDALLPGGRHDAALLDEVFLTIHRARRSYDPRRPFQSWVRAIARHVALARRPA